MKRAGGLRRTPLKRKAELAREELKKRGGQLRRSSLKRKPKPRETVRERTAREAFHTIVTSGTCVICGKRSRPTSPLHAHHVLPKEAIEQYARARSLSLDALITLKWDPDNGVAVHDDEHFGHHYSANFRIPRDRIPVRAWKFSRRLGEWAVARLEREYPT